MLEPLKEGEDRELELLQRICAIGGATVTTCWPERGGATASLINVSQKGRELVDPMLDSRYWTVYGKLNREYDFLRYDVTEFVSCFPTEFIHTELVRSGGTEEPALVLDYGVPSRRLGSLWATPLPDGRYGQEHHFRIILPRSLATEVMSLIEQNPQFIRIIDEAVTKMALKQKGFSETLWEHAEKDTSLRPPLEKVAHSLSGEPKAVNMYIHPFDEPVVFDPRRIKRVSVSLPTP